MQSMFPRRRKWQPTPVLCLENPWDRGAWWSAVHGVAEPDTTERLTQSSVRWRWWQRSCLPVSAGGVRDTGSVLWSGRSPGGGHGRLLQYSCLENPADGEACRAAVRRVTKSQTQLKRLRAGSQQALRRL